MLRYLLTLPKRLSLVYQLRQARKQLAVLEKKFCHLPCFTQEEVLLERRILALKKVLSQLKTAR